jgi:hypothetical protein
MMKGSEEGPFGSARNRWKFNIAMGITEIYWKSGKGGVTKFFIFGCGSPGASNRNGRP